MPLQEEFEEQGTLLFRYRSFIPLVVMVAGGFLYVRSVTDPGSFALRATRWEMLYTYLCLLIGLVGLFIRIYTVGHTPVNTSGRNAKWQIADSLNTTGIYSIVRHPLYLGNFFMWLGPVLMTGHFWFVLLFCFFYWIYYERIMYSEEQFLRRKFGNIYTDWADNVPAFIPCFKGFVKPALPFSWRKVLKKEKNGIAALFIIFAVMDVTGKLLNNRTDFDYFLIGCCFLTGILYLVLKYMKWHTHLLDEEGR